MRKRLSVATAAMIFACAISPAAVWAEEPATSETVVTTEEITELDLDEQDVPAVYGAPPTPTTTVATINGQSYNTLQDAINAANGQEIFLQSNVELTTGLKFSGTEDAPKNFIINANGKNLTLTELGMHAKFCNVTIKNCPELTISASKNPGENEGVTANLFAYANLTLDACDKVLIQNDGKNVCGSGLYINERGSLYVQNKTNLTVTGYMGDDNTDASGIYADTKNKDPNYCIGDLVVSGGSTLTATRCVHNGITVNPMNITVTGNSVLDVNNNNDGWYGEGGLGCYFGKLTVSDHSSVTSHDNSSWGFAIFVKDLEVDGTSEITTFKNGSFSHIDAWNADNWDGTGLAISGTAFLHSGAKVTAHDNWGIGVKVYRDANDLDNYPGGTLTVESGATLSSIHNANYGLANDHNLNIRSDAHVYLRENFEGGLDNYPLATTTVDAGADFVVSNNCGRGIKNGNSGRDHIGEPATLILNSGVITENFNTKQMPKFPFLDAKGYGHYVRDGGGIYNEYGSVTLSSAAKVYNNHAGNSGDDLYNADTEGNSFDITALEPGAKWSVLDDDQKIIDDWYKDEAGADKRWRVDNAINNTDIELPPSAALKAAHGKVAPTPSPSPTPDPTATPVPTNEPSPVPSASPVPSTPMPSAVPTVAPTTAPVQPTTAPAATAQPTATIPQTGDAAPLALFGGLTISSAAAFYFLRKRRKSE